MFLYHAIPAGMNMGIVNAGALPIYSDIEPGVKKLVEVKIFRMLNGLFYCALKDAVLNRHPGATEALLEYAQSMSKDAKKDEVRDELCSPLFFFIHCFFPKKKTEEWRTKPVKDKLIYSLVKGIADYIEKVER